MAKNQQLRRRSLAIENGVKTYKVSVLGDSFVGKSALVRQFVTGYFMTNHWPTIGTDINFKEVIVNEDIKVCISS